MFQQISRRQLLLGGLAAAGTMVVATITPKVMAQTACMPVFVPMPTDSTTQSLKTAISSNHGHLFAMPLADLLNNPNKTYNIKGNASHSHSLVITTTILNTLTSTNAVDVDSSDEVGHGHTVSLRIV